jgi:hypothetical protein
MQSLGTQARVSEGRRTRIILQEAMVDNAAAIDRRRMLGDEKGDGRTGTLRPV